MSKIRVDQIENLNASKLVNVSDIVDSSSVTTSTGTQTLSNSLDNRVIYANTISDLKALTTAGLVDGQQIQVKEYYTGTGEGGGKLYWDASSTETANNGTIFQANDTTTGRFKRPNRKTWSNIYDWGGQEGVDATTDIGPILQEAIDYFSSLGGGTVFIPAGDYYQDTQVTLKSGVNLVGDGRSQANDMGTIIIVSEGTSALYTGFANADSGFLRNVLLEGIKWRSESNAVASFGLHGAHFRYNSRLKDVGFANFGTDGINLEQSWKLQLDNCLANGNARHGLHVFNFTNNLSVLNCQFNANAQSGIRISGGANPNQAINIQSTLLESNNNGLVADDVQSLNLISNYIEGNTTYGVNLRAVDGPIDSTILLGNRYRSNSTGVFISSDAQYTLISGGHFSNNTNEAILYSRGTLNFAEINCPYVPDTETDLTISGSSGSLPTYIEHPSRVTSSVSGQKINRSWHTGSTRPSSPKIGHVFFDTSISKPIWYDGTDWRDATGAVA